MTTPRDKALEARAKALRDTPTREEQRLWENCLRSHPFRFVRQKVFAPYIVDFYCHKAKLVVEAESRWRSGERAKLHNHTRAAFLRAYGLRVLRFSAWEIDNNFCEVFEKILEALKSPPQGDPVVE